MISVAYTLQSPYFTAYRIINIRIFGYCIYYKYVKYNTITDKFFTKLICTPEY